MPVLSKPAIFSRPFFEDKSRAFWTLQAAGWTGYLILRSVSSLSNGPSIATLVPVIIDVDRRLLHHAAAFDALPLLPAPAAHRRDHPDDR